MNDNPKPWLGRRVVNWVRLRLAYLRGWVETSWLYQRLQARKYDAPARSWWWLSIRGLAILLILTVTHGLAFKHGRDRGVVRVVTEAPSPVKADLIHKDALVAWKNRTAQCEAMANALDLENRELRISLNAVPKPPVKPLVAVAAEALPQPAKPTIKPRPKQPECDWWCKLQKVPSDVVKATEAD